MIVTALTLAASLILSAQAQTNSFVWTLYEGDGPVVLAREVPDTPNLEATLECEPGDGAARIALYGWEGGTGFGSARAGASSAAIEARAGRGGRLETALRVEHPVFAAFVAGGELRLSLGDAARTLTVPPRDLAKLRRFSELCGG